MFQLFPFTSGAREFLHDVVAPAVYPERIPLSVTARHLPGEPLPAASAVDGPFVPFTVGDRWGGMWGTTWFRFQASVPPAWSGQRVVALVHLGGARHVGFSAEGLIWTVGLEPVQGLHHEHRSYAVTGPAVDFFVEAAANPIPRWHMQDWPRLEPDYAGHPLYELEEADLALVDPSVEALAVEMDLVIQIADWMPDRRDSALAAVDDAIAAVTAGGDGAAEKARAALALVHSIGNSQPVHLVTAVGHAHIDTAWLWPIRETKRKCARSFSNQLRLLEEYPEHRFVCSQAVQYQWMKDEYPSIYAGIKKQVAAGRWEPIGGMWVEADSNVPSGEALVRQFVHGKRFFASEFGVETSEMWIPDVFGYSAALPQIARQAGVDALITQKMSWNDTNQFPHTTFWWEGHDGSRVLAHFPPAATYNGNVNVAELMSDARNFKEAGRLHNTLYPFGYGDGGGGPSAGQLEALRRVGDVEGLPRVSIGSLAGFLSAVRSASSELETWVGELYLEAHRATTTTHADVKLGNRRAEEALRAAEMWSVAAGLSPDLDALWKLLLVNQFHDIIPGSSIAWVYRDAAVDYSSILSGTSAAISLAMDHLAPASGPALVAFNASSSDRDEVAQLPDGSLARVAVPACGWSPVRSLPDPGRVDVGDGWVDNGLLRVAWDDTGALTSIWDHSEKREVLDGRGNVFQIHEDHPKAFDAWDVDREYLDTVADIVGPATPRVVQPGPLRAGIRFSLTFDSSSLSQEMWLTAGSRRIEFHTSVDWQERHRFLKVAFPVAVRSQVASYEIQHGYVQRPTHANTSWDAARFEVCGHRWADLSEPGYGVALLNDCKYGYDVRGHTLRLSLLRGPGYPDPDADRGSHRFAYALLAHPGDLIEGRVVEEAEAFNLPLVVRPGLLSGPGQVVSVDRAGVSVEAVKAADDGDGKIVRLCEVHGSRRRARVTLHRPFSDVSRVDLLERRLSSMDYEGRTVTLTLRPFELVTLRFRP